MAEEKIKEIIKAMSEAGMSREEMVANLREIGIENPEQVIAEALGGAKPAAPAPAAAPGAVPAVAPAPTEGEREAKPLFEEAAPAEAGAGEAMPPLEMPSALGPSAEELGAKLEEVLALLKALQEIDRQVLATLREVLLRIRQQP